MYDIELNKKLDETLPGSNIKKAFDRAKKCAMHLQKVSTDVFQNGELTSPILLAFSDDEQTKMKEYIEAIDTASTAFVDALNLINNPENSEA